MTGKLNVKTGPPPSLYFGFSIILVFGVFSGDLGFKYTHPYTDSPSFLLFFLVALQWSVRPFQLSFPTLTHTSSYATVCH